MGIVQRGAILSLVISAVTGCADQSSSTKISLSGDTSKATAFGLTCPVMTKVEYDHLRPRVMLGASSENPMICLVKEVQNAPQSRVLNWYGVERLRSPVNQAVEVLSSVLAGPIGFTTTWTRFVASASLPYDTQFTVAPDQNINVGGKIYDVRVIKAQNPRYEDNEYWFDKSSLVILKYINHNDGTKNYTATALIKVSEP